MAKTKKKVQSDFASKAEYRAWSKRSKASKRGWKTKYLKKKNEKLAQIKNVKRNAKKKGIELPKATRKKRVKPPKHKLRETKASKFERLYLESKAAAEESERKLNELNERLLKAESRIDTSDWVDAFEPEEKTLKDGSNSNFASRLRLEPNAWELHYKLKTAEKKGFFYLTRAVLEMSALYDVELQEVYTLLHSP